MLKKNLKIELLYFDDCPSWKKALEILSETLMKLEIHEEVKLVLVDTQEEAVNHKFSGSPMIKVNGEDIFPTGQENYALGCRVYQTPDGYKGWPTKDMMLEQIKKSIYEKRTSSE